MPDTKPSAFTAATTVAAADGIPIIQGGANRLATGNMVRGTLFNGSTATVSAGYATDTYLAGSGITIPTMGGWKAGGIYQCVFDMTKTGAGTAAIQISIRIGTAGTIGDTGYVQPSFAVGTAVVDSGIFEVYVNFRSVGAGTSAVVEMVVSCSHMLAATGLITTGASGFGYINGGASAGFDSTGRNVIGVSFNGGASFSGTNTIVQAQYSGF